MVAALLQGRTLVVDRYAYSGAAFTAAKKVPGLDLEWCKVWRTTSCPCHAMPIGCAGLPGSPRERHDVAPMHGPSSLHHVNIVPPLKPSASALNVIHHCITATVLTLNLGPSCACIDM